MSQNATPASSSAVDTGKDGQVIPVVKKVEMTVAEFLALPPAQRISERVTGLTSSGSSESMFHY